MYSSYLETFVIITRMLKLNDKFHLTKFSYFTEYVELKLPEPQVLYDNIKYN